MANKILYTDKEYLINDTTVPDKNKVLDTDMNEIKSVVNSNADELDTATSNIATNTQDISSIQSEQEIQNENIQTNTDNISALSSRVSTNENDISDIKTDFNTLENTVIGQAEEIAENTSDIVVLQGKVETNETDIANIKQEQTTQNTNITNLQNNKANASDVYTKTEADNLLANKVDKVTGKGLSTNDFTDEYKDQVDTNTEDIADIQTEQTTQNNQIQVLQTENAQLKATLPTTTGEGETPTLDKTAEMEFVKPPFPGGNSGQANISYIDVGAWEQGGIDSSNGGNVSDNTYVRTVDYIPVFPNILYNISRSIYSSYNAYRFYDKNKNYIGYQGTNGMITTNQESNRMINGVSSMEMTIINTNAAYLRIVDNSNNLTTVYTMSTASPNPSYPQPITNVTGDVEVLVQNKNLFDKTNQYANNYYDDNGNEITSTNSGHFANKIKVKPNTQYTMSGFLIGSNLSNFTRIYFYDGNCNWISRSAGISTVPNTFITPSTCEYINFQLNNNPSYPLYSESIDTFQLEQGSTATTYTPHQKQTYTFPLGTQRMYLGDYLADDGIHHVRGEYRITSFIDWNSSGYYGITEIPNSKILTTSTSQLGNILCNYLTQIKQSSTWANYDNFISCIANSKKVAIKNKSEAITRAELETWLSTHNVTVEYELAEEEITPYTTEQQQAYDEIKQAISYEEQTNISGSSDEANPIFSVEAYQSIKLVLQEQAQALVALGGV